jgi:hypothetical protein
VRRETLSWLLIISIICIGAIAWLADKKNAKKRQLYLEKAEREKFNEENVLKEQLKFEKRLEANADLPDGIGWRKAYVYRHLMSNWFARLVAQYRYDEATAKKVRSDWLMYMYLLEQASTSKFLLLESETDSCDRHTSYAEQAWEEKKGYMAIEDAFAAAIGKEAIKELQYVREREHDAFDRSGKKPIAPTEYHYFPVSLRPYDEELMPKATNRPTA